MATAIPKPCRWEGRARQVAAQATFDARDRLGQITTPTLILHGNQDPQLPPSGAEQLASGIPSAKLVMIAGTGHVLRTERPDEVNRAIRAFLLAVSDGQHTSVDRGY